MMLSIPKWPLAGESFLTPGKKENLVVVFCLFFLEIGRPSLLTNLGFGKLVMIAEQALV